MSVIYNSKITTTAPIYELKSDNILLTAPRVIDDANNEILSVNSATNKIEVINRTTGLFNTELNNVGGFNELVVIDGVSNTHDIRTLQSSDGSIILNSNPDNIDFQAEITQNNVGSGEPILSNPGTNALPGNYNFKTLIGGSNVTLTPTANDITIDVTVPGTPNSDLENLGAGEPILGTAGSLPVTTTRNFKTLIGGTNVTLSSTANDITIDVTAGSGNIAQINNFDDTPPVGEYSLVQNPGTGPNTVVKNIIQGSNVTLVDNGNEITINADDQSLDLENLGAGEPVLSAGSTGSQLLTVPRNFKTLVAGSNVTLTPTANDITIDVTSPPSSVQLANLGAGNVVLTNPGTGAGPFNFKTILAGTNVTITPTANDITMNASNIYTNDGTMTTNRVLNFGNHILTLTGPGLLLSSGLSTISLIGNSVASFDGNNNVNIGASNASQVNLGRSLGTTNIYGNTNMQSLVSSVTPNVLSYDTGTKRVNYMPFTSSVQVANLGAGEVVLANPGSGAGPFNFKTLLAGINVSLSSTANDVTFNVATPNSDLENLGAGEPVLATTGSLPVTTTRNFKSLLAGTNVTLTPTANDITIDVSIPASSVDLENLGAGEVVLANPGTGAGPFNFKSFVAGTNVTLTPTANDITIDASTQNSDLENLGAGEPILGTTGVLPVTSARNFKTLLAGTNITLTPTANDITIDASSPTPNSDLENLGAGEPVLATTGVLSVTTTRNFKSLLAGTNVTLTPTANDITIDVTIPASSVQLANLGAGEVVLANPGTGAGPFNFKTLLAGTNVTLTPTANDLTITVATPNSDLENLGAGEPILSAGSTGSLPVTTVRNFKTLVAGANITLTPTANDITITAASSAITPTGFADLRLVNTMTNVPAGPNGVIMAPLEEGNYGGHTSDFPFINLGTGLIFNNTNPNGYWMYDLRVGFTNPGASILTPDTCSVWLGELPNSPMVNTELSQTIITDGNKHFVHNSGGFYYNGLITLGVYFRHTLANAGSTIDFRDVSLTLMKIQ